MHMRIAVVLLFVAQIACACSCDPWAYTPLCHRIDSVKVLFIGTAIETNDNQDGFIKGGIWYRFSVEDVLRGLPAGTREVVVDPASGTSCQEGFSIGKRYLISSYGTSVADQKAAAISLIGGPTSGDKARPPGPVVVTGVCSGSRLVEHAAEDIAFIRQYLRSPQPARIIGSVRSHASEFLWSEAYPALPAVRIVLSTPTGKTVGTTDADGHFQLPDIAPGKYSLSANLDSYKSARPSYEVQVPAHGCGVANIAMFTHAGISGSVLHSDGSPADGVKVEIHFADPKYSRAWLEGRSVKSDSQGNFKLSPLPAGDFVFGVNIDSAPTAREGILPTYWPGTTDQSKAGLIRLLPNEQRDDLVIRLGPRTPPRDVVVTVKWPDGRPATEVNVSADANGVAEMGKTSEKGVVRFVLLQNVAYSIWSRAWTSYRVAPIGKVPDKYVDGETRLPAGSGPAEVTVVLNKSKPKLY